MKKAIIIYNSHTGITKKYAEALESFLINKNIEVKLVSMTGYENNENLTADYLLIGCWTSGLFLFGQRPEKIWVNFAKQLPQISIAKVALFTTYKLATGSMFRNMKKYLNLNETTDTIELKSRNGNLSELDHVLLENYLKQKSINYKIKAAV